MRYLRCLFFSLCLCLCISPVLAVDTTAATAATDATQSVTTQPSMTGAATPLPTLATVSDLLLCAENGQVLLSKNGDEKLAPASITKLMTALVVLEHVHDLSVTTTVSDVAVQSIEPGSTHIALTGGEVISLQDLMGAMLVESANDASNVLAEYVGGSLSGFADMMNEKAQALGCTNTHFANANGLDDPAHYTTAHDMARIAQALCDYPAVFDFLGATTYEIPPTNKQTQARQFWTKQNFLRKNSTWYDADVLGGKNGWTTNAHQTLVTFKRVNGVTLIAVTLSGSSKTDTLTDTAAMFAYGYDMFHALTLSGQQLAQAAQQSYPNTDIDALQSAMVLLPNGVSTHALTYTADEVDGAPALHVQSGDSTLLSIPLTLMTQGAPAGNILDDTLVSTTATPSVLSTVLRGMLIALGILVFLFLLLFCYRCSRIRKNRRRIHAMRMRAQQQQQRNPYDRF